MLARRSVLKTLGAFFLVLLSGNTPAIADFFFKPKKKMGPRLRDNVFTRNGKALAGVSGKGGVEEMIREAVDLIGGFKKLNIKGKRVLVKPNVVSGEKNPTTTNPDVVRAVAKILYEEGAGTVFVGDMSAFRTISTARNMGRNGIKKAAEDAGAEVITFEDSGWIEVELPDNLYVKSAYVTEWLYNVDLIVNLPVIKTHRSASYSISLKNFIGCTHLRQRPYLLDSSHWEEIVGEFNAAYAPDLNIIDGTVSMIEGGSWAGTPAETNLIIASGDRIACDAIGLGIIKSFGKWDMVVEKDVWEQKQLKAAVRVKAGRPKEEIELVTGEGDKKFNELMAKIRSDLGY